MRRSGTLLSMIVLFAVGFGLQRNTVGAQGGRPRFEVTVTNLTRGQSFTPILVASHRKGVKLFTLGNAASPQLATLAEEGNTTPLAALLSSMPEVGEVVSGSGLTGPGQSATIVVRTGGGFDHLSVAAMLIPTNDGFFALNGVEGPDGERVLELS